MLFRPRRNGDTGGFSRVMLLENIPCLRASVVIGFSTSRRMTKIMSRFNRNPVHCTRDFLIYRKPDAMKTIKLGTGFAVFVLFFGIAMIEAIRNQKWLMAGFWIAMGMLFIVADNIKRNNSKSDKIY